MANVRSEYTIGVRDEVTSKLRGITAGLDKFKVGIAAIGGVVAASGAAAGALIKNAVDLADNLGKTAQKAGVSVEALSGLKYAADLSDVSIGTLSGALQKLGRQMSEAARGSESAQRGFNALGVSVRNADGSLRDTDQVFSDIAEQLSRLPDGATKTALAIQIFGRAGAQLIPLLNGGAAGLAEFRTEAEQLGVIISTETSKASEELNDNFTRLSTAATGLGVQLAAGVVPALADITTELVRAYKEGEGVLRIFGAIGRAGASIARGGDQQRLGQLLADEIGVENAIAELEARRSQGAVGKLVYSLRIKSLREELASIRREAEGLRVVLDPTETGSAPARVTRTDDAAKQRAEAAAQAALDAEEAEKKRIAAAEQVQKAQDSYLEGLRKQVALEGDSTELARVKADLQLGTASKFTDAAKAEALALAEQADIIRDTAEVREYMLSLERERAQEAERATAALAKERADTIAGLRTPVEEYTAEVQKLLSLDLGQETLQRGIEKARLAFDDATKAVEDTDSAANQLGLTFTSAFEDAVVSGNSLRDVITGLGQDILRIALRKTVTEPLGNSLSGLFSSSFGEGGGGFSGFLSGLFGNARGGLYKVGGSGGGEQPVAFTARRGEVVAVGTGMEGGGGMSVVINNYGNERVRARERRNPNGRRELEVTVGEIMQGNVAAGRTAGIGLVPPLVSR